MKTSNVMEEGVLVRKAVRALLDDLGPVETQRFLSLSSGRRQESVTRHRNWQRGLKRAKFFNEVFR